MNRDEFGWIIVRALGVITLWLLVISTIGFLLYLSLLISTIYKPELDSAKTFEHQLAVFGNLSRPIIEIAVYGLLTRYFLLKGKFAHRLICGHIPNA